MGGSELRPLVCVLASPRRGKKWGGGAGKEGQQGCHPGKRLLWGVER